MKKIEVNLPKYQWLSIDDPLAFIGSCFSLHMAQHTAEIGFSVVSNPFGTLFNPHSLAQLVLADDQQLKNSKFKVDDKYLSWYANSEVWSTNELKLHELLIGKQEGFISALRSVNTLFVTFGTAWIYELKETRDIVSNCHKQDPTLFEKRCLRIDEIVSVWNRVIMRINELNKSIQVVFTVSPVRHKKDGLIENNQSKARLIESVHTIVKQHEKCYYFPAYEIVIDELRDYSYFERDGVHPNRYCIEEIAHRFEDVFLAEESKAVIAQYKALKSMIDHKHIHPGTDAAKKFDQQREEKIDRFLKKHPEFQHLLRTKKS